MRNSITVVTLLTLIGQIVHSQATPPRMFEVASVKRVPPQAAGGGLRGGPGTSDPGQITYTAATLTSVLLAAYGVHQLFQISGPEWLNTERYDVTARIPEGATREQFKLMLQNLLADRFHLALHHETKDFQAYELLLDKSGSKLKESVEDSGTPREPSSPAFRQISPQARSAVLAGMTLSGSNQVLMAGRTRSTEWLAEGLGTQLGIPVVDKTGLTGKYDYYLEFAPPRRPPGAPPDDNNPLPSIFNAVQEQLGLKLDEKKLPFDVLVIDRVEKIPAEN
jgi:uncharacterized protein (TIGR03435 family)